MTERTEERPNGPAAVLPITGTTTVLPVVAADDDAGPEETDPFDSRWALAATGVLRDWNVAGVLDAADVHIAVRTGQLVGEKDESVLLAMALTVAAARDGSVCIDLADPAVIPEGVSVPEPSAWIAAVRQSRLTTDHGLRVSAPRPLRLDGGLLYLDRYWSDEVDVADDLRAREDLPPPEVDDNALTAAVEKFFPLPTAADPDEQRRQVAAVEVTRDVARSVARRWTTVLGGGPGTGKTTTVARVLAVLAELTAADGRPPLRIALAAPTGKAAARLSEAVGQSIDGFDDEVKQRLQPLSASTLHRLLVSRPGRRNQFRHDRDNRLPHDVLVVDEASMVSLTMMSRLLAAVGTRTRLVLVGDPHQLASVDAGAVLADIAEGLSGADPDDTSTGKDIPPDATLRRRSPASDRSGAGVILLQHIWRFGGGIAELADAVRAGDVRRAEEVLRRGADDVVLVPTDALDPIRDEVVGTGSAIRSAATSGRADDASAALDLHRVLCGHRTGPAGVAAWRQRVEWWLAAAHGGPEVSLWYPGRPLLVTANDYALGLFNGDTGVVVTDEDGLPTAVFGRGSAERRFRPSRLGQVETVHAMTVHRSQGSQFDKVTLVLPEPESPLLTRELVYTALTRAKEKVWIVGDAETFLRAVAVRAARASGLARRLRSLPDDAAGTLPLV